MIYLGRDCNLVPRVIDITIPMRLPTLNEMLRMHWATRKRLHRGLSGEVLIALRALNQAPAQPIARCSIRIERHSPRSPDPDNLVASVKPLLDVLQPGSARHKYGLGVILGDDAGTIRELAVMHVKAPPGTERTRIVIREDPLA